MVYLLNHHPDGNCMLKVKNRNTGTRCEMCSRLTIHTTRKTPLVKPSQTTKMSFM